MLAVPGGSWFDYVLGWEETLKNNPQLQVLVLHYEDVKEVRCCWPIFVKPCPALRTLCGVT